MTKTQISRFLSSSVVNPSGNRLLQQIIRSGNVGYLELRVAEYMETAGRLRTLIESGDSSKKSEYESTMRSAILYTAIAALMVTGGQSDAKTAKVEKKAGGKDSGPDRAVPEGS